MEAGSTTRAISARPEFGRCRARAIFVCSLLGAVLGGCASVPEPEPEPWNPLRAIVAPQHERLAPVPDEPAPVEPAPAPPPVAILVSSTLPAYKDVAYSLIDMLDESEYVLGFLDAALASDSERTAAMLNEAEPRVVVAIGLEAALLAREQVDAPLVFCQVFNYSDYPELEDAAAGVSMLAAFDEQLAFWKAVDETLGTVGTIVGPGHDDLISASAAAAESHGISLDVRVSDSDRETVYHFKRLAAEIDGFWLIPDNRILSMTAIEELMSYAAARHLPVVVSTPELLRFGALMSLKPSPLHVADAVYSVLGSLQNYALRGFELVTPQSFEVDVNRGVASRLGIGID